MKKILLWVAVFGFSTALTFGQDSKSPATKPAASTQPAPVTPAVKKDKATKPAPVTPATPAVKKEKMKNKSTAAPASETKTVAPVLKKDGTPDKRYKASQKLKKDGTPDMRYKENKPAAPAKPADKK